MDNEKLYNAIIAVCQKMRKSVDTAADLELIKHIVNVDTNAIEKMCESAIILNK